jgi:hypothetical protein
MGGDLIPGVLTNQSECATLAPNCKGLGPKPNWVKGYPGGVR